MAYPPVGFFFDVAFLNRDIPDSRFQSVSGLSVDFQTETLKEGGENRFEYVLPTRTRYNPLVLKRGLEVDSSLIAWCQDALLNYDIQPQDLLVRLLTVDRPDPSKPPKGLIPLMSWKVVHAWPKKWSVSDFNAEQGNIAIETLELQYQYFEVET